MHQLAQADRNIRLYPIIKSLAKRVFLPLTAIYFMETANITLLEIGFMSAFFSIVQFIAEIPTGYFADVVGRVTSLRTGAYLAALATTIYVFFHHKTGIYIGVLLEALAYSFMGGAGEALIHDSLVIKNQTDKYTSILTKSMSISLIANAILVSVVPMTYQIDKRLPFFIGTLIYLLLAFTTYFFKDLGTKNKFDPKIPQLSAIPGKRYIVLFAFSFGIISALYTSPADTVNIALKSLGANPAHIGWIYGIASIVGFGLGHLIHKIQNLSLGKYLVVDVVIMSLVFITLTLQSIPLIALAMIIGISFWRYRRITYQNYALNVYGNSYKATLVSSLNSMEQLSSIWLPIVITSLVSYLGLQYGFAAILLLTLLIAPVFYYSTLKFFKIL